MKPLSTVSRIPVHQEILDPQKKVATQSRDRNHPRAPMSSESGEDMPSEVEPADQALRAIRLAKFQHAISRLEGDDADGHKKVPPMDILHFPELINEAWHEDRLVPWRDGHVKWDKYLNYIRSFHDLCDHPDLHSALDLCLEREDMYIKGAPAKIWGDMSLSKAIRERIDDMKQIDEITLPEGESAVAAAVFMCIAEEALLMSVLEEDEGYLVNFSDDVRQHAFNLMGYKGSDYKVVCAALLGMKKEAELMRICLIGYASNCDEEIVTSGSVRQHTLEVLNFFIKLFAHDISDGNQIKGAAGKTSSVDGTNGLGNNEIGLPNKDDTADKCDGTGITKKKMISVAKIKNAIQLVLKRTIKKKLTHSRKSQALATIGK